MDANRFRELEALFEQALLLDRAGREALLDDLRARDHELAARLSAMLAADGNGADVLGKLAGGPVVNSERPLPDKIGPFRVLSKLGEGGMGVVYLGQRKTADFEQLLAIKRLNAAVDNELARQRLLIEQRVLASLRHPHIAQFVDGGEDADGTPYVAMEFVDGVPLLEYAQGHQLSQPERVELFLDLCQAVQFAHQHLVVHRDIKAGNVMIDKHGKLKLLDFGIAKLLGEERDSHDRTVLTVAGAMTPHYASPEQIRGEAVTPLTDIYSLGVLLYELLAGRRPYEFKTRRPTEIERIICLSEPGPPLSTRRGRDTDLNSIVLKAMHKESGRRYQSPGQLAEDLQRWLSGHPVQARPDSRTYRWSVFARRHPVGLGLTGLIAILLVGFSASMAWQAHQLALERDRATREAAVATETADFLVELFAVSDPRESNPSDVRARDLLDRAAETLPSELDSDPLMRSSLLHVIGLAYANLGDDETGTTLLTEALALREMHAGADSAEVADSRNRLGNVHRRFGRLQDAEPLLVSALEWRLAQGVVNHDLADSYNNVGLLQNELGWYDRAEASLRQSIALHREAGGNETRQAAAPLHNLALSLRRQDRFEEARASAMESLAIKRANDWSESSLANTLAVLANIERSLGALESALSYSSESLALRRSVFGEDNVMIASGLATHASVLAASGQSDEAIALVLHAIALHESAGSLDSLRGAEIQLSLVRLLADRGRMDEASRWQQRAEAVARRELPPDSPELERFLQPY